MFKKPRLDESPKQTNKHAVLLSIPSENNSAYSLGLQLKSV